MRHVWNIDSVSLALCKQENTQDIALDTLQSLVSVSEVRECVTQTLEILQISRDPQTLVHCNLHNFRHVSNTSVPMPSFPHHI